MRRRPLALRASLVRGMRERARDERGLTLIESVMGMMLFAFIAVALIGLLNSAIAANSLSRQKTVAQQLAQDEVEDIRRRPYDQIGIVGGNPNGTVPATRALTVSVFRGVPATMTKQIQWVNDPTPTSYATAANYKKVTVTVTSDRDGRVLTRVVTFIAPPSRAPFGGLNNAILNVTVKDLQDNAAPIPDALVTLRTGPSAVPPISDTTDPIAGLVTFAALTPNPLPPDPKAYYDIDVAKSGYETYVDDISPAAPAHVQLDPSETENTTIRLYRPVTIYVAVLDPSGNPYAPSTAIYLKSERSGTTEAFTATGGATGAITSFAGRPTAPGNFTVWAYAGAAGLCAGPITQLVWAGYPTTLSSTITVQLQPCPTIDVTATWASQPAGNVGGTTNVTVTGGPVAGATYASGQTNASGTVSMPVFATTPANPYTVTAAKNGGSGSATVTTVPLSGGVPASIALTPTKTLTLRIQANGVDIPNQPVTVSLTDGPNGAPNVVPAYQFVGNTNGTSRVVLTVPVHGTETYTVKVYRTGCPGATNRSRTQTVSAASGITTATINMTTATCPLTLP